MNTFKSHSLILFFLIISNFIYSQEEYNLETCETSIATGVPDFFQKYFKCVTIRMSESGDYVNLYYNGLPPYNSWYYPPDNSNNINWENQGEDCPNNNPCNNGECVGSEESCYFQIPGSYIVEQNYVISIPVNPIPRENNNTWINQEQVNGQLSTGSDITYEYPLGSAGSALNGVNLFNPCAAGEDLIEDEAWGFDFYSAHPGFAGEYHYHTTSPGPLEVLAYNMPDEVTSTEPGNAEIELYGIMCDGTIVMGCKELDESPVDFSQLDAQNGHIHEITDEDGSILFESRYHTHICYDEVSTGIGPNGYEYHEFTPEISYYKTPGMGQTFDRCLAMSSPYEPDMECQPCSGDHEACSSYLNIADCYQHSDNTEPDYEGCLWVGSDGQGCDEVDFGCMDDTACNFDENATYDEGCVYEAYNHDCEGNCTATGENLENGYDCTYDVGINGYYYQGWNEDSSCGGSASLDVCGNCGYWDEYIDICDESCEDCLGTCGGNAAEDCNGDCFVIDSAEFQFEDGCGVCGGNGCYQQNCEEYPNNLFDCDGICRDMIDCDGVCSGNNMNCDTYTNPDEIIGSYSVISDFLYPYDYNEEECSTIPDDDGFLEVGEIIEFEENEIEFREGEVLTWGINEANEICFSYYDYWECSDENHQEDYLSGQYLSEENCTENCLENCGFHDHGISCHEIIIDPVLDQLTIIYIEATECAILVFQSLGDLSNNDLEIASQFNITNIYPNPFNPATTIAYYMPKHTSVSIDVYNINGQLVENLYNGFKSPGEHSIEWNAINNITTGVYLIRMTSGLFVETKKIIYLK